MPSDRPQVIRHWRRRRQGIGQVATEILPIVRPPQAAEGNEIVEQDLAGGRVHAE